AFAENVGDPGGAVWGGAGRFGDDLPAGGLCGLGDDGLGEDVLFGLGGGGALAAAGMREELRAERAGLGDGLVPAAGCEELRAAVSLLEGAPGVGVVVEGLDVSIVEHGSKGHVLSPVEADLRCCPWGAAGGSRRRGLL